MAVRVLQVVTIMDRGGEETMIMNYYRQMDRRKFSSIFWCIENKKVFTRMKLRSWVGKSIGHFQSAHGITENITVG